MNRKLYTASTSLSTDLPSSIFHLDQIIEPDVKPKDKIIYLLQLICRDQWLTTSITHTCRNIIIFQQLLYIINYYLGPIISNFLRWQTNLCKL